MASAATDFCASHDCEKEDVCDRWPWMCRRFARCDKCDHDRFCAKFPSVCKFFCLKHPGSKLCKKEEKCTCVREKKHPMGAMIVGADKKCFKLGKKECEESEKCCCLGADKCRHKFG